ncbi:TPA: winged helix-turn-helix domain-containing protein [Klebsiella aerogenes]|nr:winged helix-turn-helix domain-containing protein [Klebsiella oxytoca]HCR0223757.1 winged helix-turn-helix domain-containing protein [Klebsiella aerogenes]HCR0512065.1 winged helix-turn-helix domain-containing protein [Klebsiella aerogenes]
MTVHSYIINKKILFNYKECYLCSIESSNREVIGSNPSGLLLYLIKNHGNAITIDEISNYFIVKGRVVNATTAIQYISKLRKTLKTLEENTSVIATIKGGGYYIPSYIEITEYNPEENVSKNTGKIEIDEYISDVESNEVKNVQKRFIFNGKWISIFGVFSFLICILSFFIIFNDLLSLHLDEVDYRMVKNDSGCNIYVDHDFPERGSKAENILMMDVALFCNKGKYAYLTYFEYSNNYSVIFCKKPIYKNKGRDICSSLSRFGND